MVKAAQVASSQEFLELLEKSGLLTEQQLGEARSLAGQSGDAKAFARQLLSRSFVTKWQATQLLNGFGQFSVGKYRLLDQLGVGRLGREFLAEHLQLGRRVALKLVSRGLTADPKRLKTFLAEFRRAGSLDHPHLVHAHDVDQEGQRFYVVTEFVDGENLRQRVQKNGPPPLNEALDWLKQAAEGLAFAAAAGVIHGDLKPSNLLVDREGVLKVSDLGFARLVDVSPTEAPPRDSQEQKLSDSGEFSAPEVHNQVEGDMDVRADIYSLGQVLYFLVTGQLPAAPPVSLEERQKMLLEKQPQLSAEVASVYARFTSPAADNRPADWNAALQALNDLAAALPQETAATAEAVVIEIAPTTKRKPPVAQAIAIAEDGAAESEAVVVETAEPQPFVIDTKGASPRGKASAKKPAAAAATAVAEPAAEAAATPAKPQKPGKKGQPLNPKLLLGGIIGGGVLLLLLGIGVVMMLVGGGSSQEPEKQVAKAATPEKKEKKNAKKPDTSEAESNPAEVNPTEEVNPAEVNPSEVNPTSLTSTDAKPAPDAATEPATSAPGSGMPPMPMTEKPAEPSPAPTPPAESKPAATPAPEPAKPEAPKTEPPKPEPPKPEPPKPEPPKPAPPKPAAPQAKPFEKLPTVVDLPPLPTPEKPAAPAVLGEIHVSPEQLVSILLNGGEDAARGKQVFSLQNANGTDPRNWEVSLTGKAGEESTVIAKLHLDQNKFSFEWTPEAAQQAAAPYLANCLLKMSAGKDVSSLALRKPVETEEPVTLDMEKGSVLKLAVENTPDPKKVRVELVGLNPVMFPNPEFKPEATVEAAKGTMYVWLGDKPEQRGLGLRVETADRGKTIEVRFQPQFRLDPQAQPLKLTKKLLPDLSARLEQSMAALTARSAAVQASNLPKDRKEQAKTAFDQEQTKAKEQHERVLAAIELHKRMHEAAVAHVRVTYATEAGPVVLAQTKGAPPPTPPDAKK
jgi:serine/threonine protein kinase